MEKIKVKVGQRIDSTMLLDKQNEIIDWIKKHEKYVQPLEKAWKQAIKESLKEFLGKAKEKQGA